MTLSLIIESSRDASSRSRSKPFQSQSWKLVVGFVRFKSRPLIRLGFVSSFCLFRPRPRNDIVRSHSFYVQLSLFDLELKKRLVLLILLWGSSLRLRLWWWARNPWTTILPPFGSSTSWILRLISVWMRTILQETAPYRSLSRCQMEELWPSRPILVLEFQRSWLWSRIKRKSLQKSSVFLMEMSLWMTATVYGFVSKPFAVVGSWKVSEMAQLSLSSLVTHLLRVTVGVRDQSTLELEVGSLERRASSVTFEDEWIMKQLLSVNKLCCGNLEFSASIFSKSVEAESPLFFVNVLLLFEMRIIRLNSGDSFVDLEDQVIFQEV